uniref:Metallophos_C domain-containing protein n=1 Tax=Steinernema glaseri TaxID=37863 RepID=A0A1I7Y2P8_9BILA
MFLPCVTTQQFTGVSYQPSFGHNQTANHEPRTTSDQGPKLVWNVKENVPFFVGENGLFSAKPKDYSRMCSYLELTSVLEGHNGVS